MLLWTAVCLTESVNVDPRIALTCSSGRGICHTDKPRNVPQIHSQVKSTWLESSFLGGYLLSCKTFAVDANSYILYQCVLFNLQANSQHPLPQLRFPLQASKRNGYRSAGKTGEYWHTAVLRKQQDFYCSCCHYSTQSQGDDKLSGIHF